MFFKKLRFVLLQIKQYVYRECILREAKKFKKINVDIVKYRIIINLISEF